MYRGTIFSDSPGMSYSTCFFSSSFFFFFGGGRSIFTNPCPLASSPLSPFELCRRDYVFPFCCNWGYTSGNMLPLLYAICGMFFSIFMFVSICCLDFFISLLFSASFSLSFLFPLFPSLRSFSISGGSKIHPDSNSSFKMSAVFSSIICSILLATSSSCESSFQIESINTCRKSIERHQASACYPSQPLY